jgi:hypothetical protein
MHKIIHKLIRMNRDGMNVVADVNVVVASGGEARARSRNRIVQRNGRSVTVTESGSEEDVITEKEV